MIKMCCDMCGCELDIRLVVVTFKHPYRTPGGLTVGSNDLCIDCMNKVKEFIKKGANHEAAEEVKENGEADA